MREPKDVTSTMPTQHVTGTAAMLRRAAVRAVRAPSVHNTQPWRLVLGPDALTVLPDRTRQVPIFDPSGRQLLLSCGCAAANAQIALAADGSAAAMHVIPGAGQWPITRIELESGPRDEGLAELDAAIDRRSTPRTPMLPAPLPAALIAHLQAGAAAGGVQLGAIQSDSGRVAVERLAQLGSRVLCTYPEYLSELRAWTTGPARADGLPSSAFDVLAGQGGELRTGGASGEREPCDLLWIATTQDDAQSWVEAGAVLQRVLLELTRVGMAAVPLAQIIEVPRQRAALAEEAGISGRPQVVLRVGTAPVMVPTRRRRLVDVIG